MAYKIVVYYRGDGKLAWHAMSGKKIVGTDGGQGYERAAGVVKGIEATKKAISSGVIVWPAKPKRKNK